MDIFELLDISRREDSYSSLLRNLLMLSPGLGARVLDHGYGQMRAPRLENIEVHLRTKLPGEGGIVDLLITGNDIEGKSWELFIENKIDARESPEQTVAYLKACRSRAGKRAVGIFLTLDGRAAQATEVVSLQHRELALWVEQNIAELSDPVARRVAEAYVHRARVSPPRPTSEQAVGALVYTAEGLQPRNIGWDTLGRQIVEAAQSGWSHYPLWIQGPGQGNPGLQFHRKGWWGKSVEGQTFKRENVNVHAEIALTPKGLWRLKIHFETEPYMTKKQLANELVNYEKFVAMRKVFRKAVHERASDLSRWKMTNYALQVCSLELGISMESTVGDTVREIAEGLREIGRPIDDALNRAMG